MMDMNQAYIEQFDVIQRYLHGKLTAQELEAFEHYILLHPEILEELELSDLMTQGLAMAPSAQQAPKTGKGSWKTLMQGVFGVATGAFATWLVMGPMSVGTLTDRMVSPAIVYVEPVRGVLGQDVETTQLSRDAMQHILVLDVSGHSVDHFLVELSDQNGKPVKQWKGLATNDRGELVIQLDVSELPDSHYDLSVSENQKHTIMLRTKILLE